MRRLILVGAALLGLALGITQGCSLLDEDTPGRHCTGNPDCFVNQGETCNLATNECETRTVMDGGGTD